jgi:hypothetical protein
MSAAKPLPVPRLHLVGEGLRRRLEPSGVGREGNMPGIDVSGNVSWPTPHPVRPDTFEMASAGFDPNLQLIGGDPWGDPSWAGLVVPTGPGTETPNFKRRYLFLLAWMRLDNARRGKVVGVRTSVRLGANVAGTVEGLPYPVEHEIVDPFWKSTTGNVCFFLRRIPSPGQHLVFNTLDGPSLNFRYANTPALLYESLAPYVPPGNGVPPGVDISPGLGSWQDGRFGPWRSEDALGSTDIAVQGPCDIGLFASVFQMPIQKNVPESAAGLDPDDAFLANHPTAQFKRVAGSFFWKEVTAE